MNTRSGFLKRLGLAALEAGQRPARVLDLRGAHQSLADEDRVHAHALEVVELLATVASAVDREIPEAFERFQFSHGLEAWLKAVFACNAYVDDQAPWALRKTDPERMAAVLGTVVHAVRRLAEAIAPVTPASAAKLIALIDSGGGGQAIGQPVPIFPRLELEAEGEGA